MAEPDRFTYTYAEVAEALIKQQNLHEGIWTVSLKFGLGATRGGPSELEAVPAAIVPVLSIGLSKVGKESQNAIDAAKVNPGKKVSLKGTAIVSAPGKLRTK
jgi:hypothetical protein